jgi:hypothetical protein
VRNIKSNLGKLQIPSRDLQSSFSNLQNVIKEIPIELRTQKRNASRSLPAKCLSGAVFTTYSCPYYSDRSQNSCRNTTHIVSVNKRTDCAHLVSLKIIFISQSDKVTINLSSLGKT